MISDNSRSGYNEEHLNKSAYATSRMINYNTLNPMTHPVCVYLGAELAQYAFGNGHPFGPQRYTAFTQEFERRNFHNKIQLCKPAIASASAIARFHSQAYIEKVKQQSQTGAGFLDNGDTPAFKGMFEAARYIVGTVLDGIDKIMRHHCQHVFIPIAGLHHAHRDHAGGFCVFNDCGIAIETLRAKYAVKKVAYIDIDAHHSDGVYYAFECDPDLVYVDFHEDGNYLYPGSGHEYETGKQDAKGTKLNIPLPPGVNDAVFLKAWPQAEAFIRQGQPEFILLQCGTDSIAGDPLTHLQYSAKVHEFVTQRCHDLAHELCEGRLLAMGGGGYHLENIAHGWNTVIAAMLKNP